MRSTPRPVTRLADARPFVDLCDLAYVAAGAITPVPDRHRQKSTSPKDGGQWVAIAGLEDAARNFLEQGRWPEATAMPWAARHGSATPADLPRLGDTVRGMSDKPCT